jgi:hypothetical protein
VWLVHITPRNDDGEVEEFQDSFRTKDFSKAEIWNYETMADYAELTIEAD